MLKGIPKIVSPLLLKTLCEMGHGDEIVLADANFPSESIAQNNQIIRADGIGVLDLLHAILPLFPLDQYDPNSFVVMAVEEQDSFSSMGIDYEEKAFYDILIAVAEKFHFEFPESENIMLAKEIRAALRDN